MEPVSRWSTEQVQLWMTGLDAGLQEYAGPLGEHGVDGEALLAMTPERLEVIGVARLGHQELLLHAAGLLGALHRGAGSESVASWARRLIAAARGLQGAVGRQHKAGAKEGTVSTELLTATLQLIAVAKALLAWLDRFSAAEEFVSAHNAVVQLCLQLSKVTRQVSNSRTTGGQQQTAPSKNCSIQEIEDKILHVGSRLQQVCEQTILGSCHPDLQTGARLVTVRLDVRSPEEGLGLYLKTTPEGMHVVTGVVENSPADLSGKIHDGDELIAVDRQTVVGWEMQNVVRVLKKDPSGVEVTLKTHPPFATVTSDPAGPTTAVTSDPAAPTTTVTSDPAATAVTSDLSASTTAVTSDPAALTTAVTSDATTTTADPTATAATSDPVAPTTAVTSERVAPTTTVTSDPPACPHKGQRIRRQKPLDRHAKVKVVVDPAHHARPEEVGATTPVDTAPRVPPPAAAPPPCSNPGGGGAGAGSDGRPQPEGTPAARNGGDGGDDGVGAVVPVPNGDVGGVGGGGDGVVGGAVVVAAPHPVAIAPLVLRGERACGRSRSFSRGGARGAMPAGGRPGDGGGSARDHGLSHHQSLPADFRMPENVLKVEGVAASMPGPSEEAGPPGGLEHRHAIVVGGGSAAGDVEQRRAGETGEAENHRSGSERDVEATPAAPAEILPSVLRPLSGTAASYAANNVHMRNKSEIKGKATKMSRRRISCKDLGAGDLEGWLWKKKQIKSFFKPTWNRFWFVLQRSSVYWYTHRNDLKADGYVSLQGFKIDRALESRRKFAFKATHPSIKPLYFATDGVDDMNRWIEKLRVVAITSTSTEKHGEAADVSESEDESEDSCSLASSSSSLGSRHGSSSVLRAPSLPVLCAPADPLAFRHCSTERLCPLASPSPASCQQLHWESPPAAPTAAAATVNHHSLTVSKTPSLLRRSLQALFGSLSELELAGVGAATASAAITATAIGDDGPSHRQKRRQQGHARSASDAEPVLRGVAGTTEDGTPGGGGGGDSAGVGGAARRNSWQGHGPRAGTAGESALGRLAQDARVGSLPELASRRTESPAPGPGSPAPGGLRRSLAAATAEVASPTGEQGDGWDSLYHALSEARLFPHGAERVERSASSLRQSFMRRCRNPHINQRLLRLQGLHRALQARESELRTIDSLLSAGTAMSADGFREWKLQHGEHVLAPDEAAVPLLVLEGHAQACSTRLLTETEI